MTNLTKSIKVSISTHKELKVLADISGATIIDYTSALVHFVKFNNLDYVQLISKTLINPFAYKIDDKLVEIASLIKNLERGRLNPLLKSCDQIEKNLNGLMSLIIPDPNISEREYEEDSQNSQTLKVQDTVEYKQLLNEKQRSKIRERVAYEAIENILSRAVNTERGMRRAFSKNEIEEYTKLLDNYKSRGCI